MHSILLAFVAVGATAQSAYAIPTLAIEQMAAPRAVYAVNDRSAPLPPRSWNAQDPADSLWRAARVSLDNGNPREAANLYRRLRTERRYSASEYRSHAFYWEAFARQRLNTATELRTARSVLADLRREYPRFENMAEVDRLDARLTAELARHGDNSAATEQAQIRGRATAQCPDQEIKVAVVESLLMSSTEQAMPTLKTVMARRDECSAELREKAVFIISQKRSPEAEDLLLDAARNDPSPKVREQAVFWLSQVNTEKAVSAIDQILRTSNDPKLVEQAVFALSQHRSERARQILREIAGRAGSPMEARKNAIFWLGQSRGAESATFLRELYPSLSEKDLKEAVLFAMSQSNADGSADFLLDIAMNTRESTEMRKSALFWAGQKRAIPLSRLGELYNTMPDRAMREQVIFAISQRREPESVDRLIDIARRERDVELRKNAIFWLGQKNDPRATRFLSELIGG